MQLFDHLIGAGEHRRRHVEAERLGSLEIDHQRVLRCLLDWQVSCFSASENFVDVNGGATVVSHGRYVVFQMAEVAIARQMFQEILRLIAELRPQPPPALT